MFRAILIILAFLSYALSYNIGWNIHRVARFSPGARISLSPFPTKSERVVVPLSTTTRDNIRFPFSISSLGDSQAQPERLLPTLDQIEPVPTNQEDAEKWLTQQGREGREAREARERISYGASESDGLSSTIQEILKIASDKRLSHGEQVQLIREVLPAPIFPYETEPGMMGETRIAKSFGHLNDLLFLDSWGEHNDKLGPFKLYRGVPDASMKLLTSLQRLVEPDNHIKSSKPVISLSRAASLPPSQVSHSVLKRIEQVPLNTGPTADHSGLDEMADWL